MAKKKDDLDMNTTFADMNVDGFKWSNPGAKNGKDVKKTKITKKEYRAMIKGALSAYMPFIGCVAAAMLIVFLLAYIWLS